MKRLALSALLHTRRLALFTVLALALVLLAARALAPFAEVAREELAEQLGALLGMRVEVGALTLRFDAWSPRLALTDVALCDTATDLPVFRARELRVALDLLASWQARRWRIDGLTLVGAEFELRRTQERRLQISGLQTLGGGRDPGALAFFLREGRFALSNSRLLWTDHTVGAPTLALNIDRLLIINHQQDHRLWLDARLVGEPTTLVSARAHLVGTGGDFHAWRGRLYAHLDSRADLGALARPWLPSNMRLQLRGPRLETWIGVEHGRPVGMLARLRADALSTAPAAALRQPDPPSLTGLSALVHWARDEQTSHLRIAALRAYELGDDPLSIALRLHPPEASADPDRPDPEPAATRRLLGGVGEIELQALRRLIEIAAPAQLAALPAHLLHAPLAGRLERLHFALDLPEAGWRPSSWRIKGDVHGLGIPQQGDWPGTQGLNLTFDAQPGQGLLRLASDLGVLDLRPRLAEPTPIRHLRAELGWHNDAHGALHVRLPGARLQTPDLNAALHTRMSLHHGTSPQVDVHLRIRDADARALGRYLPVRVLDAPLVDWLKRAVRGGQVSTGDFLLRGRLADFPFDNRAGHFVMVLRIANGVLDYSAPPPGATPAARWPALENLDADVRIVNRRLEIGASRGRFLDSDLQSGHAFIPNLWTPERMFIRLQGRGPFADGRRTVLETPLHNQLGRLAQAFEVDGSLGIALELAMPFRRGAEIDYQGELRWDGQASASLHLGSGRAPLRLHGIEGTLGFSNQGVSARDIQARLGEQRLEIAARTEPAGPGDGSGTTPGRTRVEVRGKAKTALLARQFPSPLWRLVDGDPAWRLDIDLANRDLARADAPIDLTLSSTLQGVALHLPEPFGKRPGAAMPAQLNARLLPQGLHEPLLRLGPLQGCLTLATPPGEPPRLRSASLAINAEPPPPPQQPGIAVTGQLPSLDLGAWLDWWSKHGAHFTPPDPALPVRVRNLAIAQAKLGTLRLTDIDATFDPGGNGGGQVRFQARENSGTIDFPVPGSTDPLRVSLAHWTLDPSAAQSPPDRLPTRPNPARIGPVELRIATLRWNQNTLGQFAVDLIPDAAGLNFQDLRLKGSTIEAEGSGRWRGAATGSDEQTGLDLTVRSADAGDLLRALDLHGQLQGGLAEVQARLDWPGNPGEFALARARGHIQFDLANARLPEVNLGAGRMLGILNVSALRRRLSLDFSDLIDAGFSFDQASGAFALANGIARIERFDLLSSTADIRITGTANLFEKTLYQIVTVEPKVSSSVALASAVAGGPLVGAAVLLADTVTGRTMDRLSSHQYRISGSWENPEIDLLGMNLGERSPPQAMPENRFLENF